MDRKYNLYLNREFPTITDEMLVGTHTTRALNIPKEIIKLPIGAFHNYTKLKKVYFEIGSHLRVLPDYIFSNCIQLSKLNILPSDLVSIGAYAFENCVSLKEIIIPKSVEYIEPNSFNGWKEDQIIRCYKNYDFGLNSKAQILNLDENITEKFEIDVITRKKGEYGFFIVKAKCGHVGKPYYIPIDFPIVAYSAKEAAQIARQIHRVKHNHKDAIISVKEVSKLVYMNQMNVNKNDPYLQVSSKHEQELYLDSIEKRRIADSHYRKYKDKRIKPIVKKSGSSTVYKLRKNF